MLSKILPGISLYREEMNAEYIDIRELDNAVRDREQLFPINKYKGALTRQMIGSIDLRAKPAWICSKCKYFEVIHTDFLANDISLDEIKTMGPSHCGDFMQLGSIPFYHKEIKLTEQLDILNQKLKDGSYDKSSVGILDYFLSLFANSYLKKMVIQIL